MHASPLYILIPARFGSTRFPGKPLALIHGVPMILRVLERLSPLKQEAAVVVATDHEEIAQTVEKAGHRVVMTSSNHPSGTDRLAEAATLLGIHEGRVINVQGDEPFVDPMHVLQLAQLLLDRETDIATLVCPIDSVTDYQNPNVVKAVFDKHQRALYFSRAPIPHHREEHASSITAYRHLGIYGYQAEVLQAIAKLPPGALEKKENLEQLRWLQEGYSIRVATAPHAAPAVDTPEDLVRVNNLWITH